MNLNFYNTFINLKFIIYFYFIMNLFNNMLEKFSSKQVSNENILLYGNLWLIPTALTFVVFNIMKTKVFDGYIIGLMELFYTSLMLFVGFYFASKNICCEQSQIIKCAIQHALLVLLLCTIVTSRKEYINPKHIIMVNLWILGITYNVVLYMIRNNVKKYCNKKPINKKLIMLVLLHLSRIYFLR